MTDTGEYVLVEQLPDELDVPKPMTPSQLATAALGLYEEYPLLHNQNYWFLQYAAPGWEFDGVDTTYPEMTSPDCGTRMCVAGTVCMLSGFRLVSRKIGEGLHPFAVHPARPDELLLIADLGERLLRLGPEKTRWLFHESTNDEAVGELIEIAHADDAV